MSHYPIPPHLQKAYKGSNLLYDKLQVTEMLANEVLSLPIHQAMTETEVETVVKTLNAAQIATNWEL
jgi:dTDP-4-amino-4,6-dideoxygalactose transaminase